MTDDLLPDGGVTLVSYALLIATPPPAIRPNAIHGNAAVV